MSRHNRPFLPLLAFLLLISPVTLQLAYGYLDPLKGWGGFGFYFIENRAAAYVKHPDDRAWLFDPDTMKPRVNNPAWVQAIQDVGKMLECARQMEEDSAKQYNQWANECGANADAVSKKLFEELVADEERHYDQYDTELENMAKYGDRYLALQSIERSKTVAAGMAPTVSA